MDQIQKNLNSIKKKKKATNNTLATETNNQDSDRITDAFPTQEEIRTHLCYAAVIEASGQIYTDQTGRFILPSSRGNNYLLVLYDYDSNAILAKPIPSRTAKAILASVGRGHCPRSCFVTDIPHYGPWSWRDRVHNRGRRLAGFWCGEPGRV
jgi:hypothetical protein